MCSEPTLNRRRLVSGGVVENQMDVEVGGDIGIDLLEEGQEFLGAMAGVQSADNLPGCQIQCGIQA
jgi:hypothetical protein